MSMAIYTVYDHEGKILRTGSCPKEQLPHKTKEGEHLIEGFAHYATQRINPDTKEILTLPEAPPQEKLKPSLDSMIHRGCLAADKMASKARESLVTSYPGQMELYREKARQARLVLEKDKYSEDEVELVRMNAKINKLSMEASARSILGAHAEANRLIFVVEEIRLMTKKKIRAAESAEDAIRIAKDMKEQLAVI